MTDKITVPPVSSGDRADVESGQTAGAIAGKNHQGAHHIMKRWLSIKERITLLRWSSGFFILGTIPLLVVALRYFSVYTFTGGLLSFSYVIAAFTSHFASIMLLVWIAAMFPLIVVFPFRKLIIPLGILAVSLIVTVVLLDSQVFAAHRFHFTLLTIHILGWKTWGFGILYLAILLVFNSFLGKIVWDRNVVMRKKLHLAVVLPAMVVLLLFTHGTHMWADATGYVPVTRFTTTLPLFYPAVGKRQMVKYGLVDIAKRRNLQASPDNRSGFNYPLAPLKFTPVSPLNILVIAIDGMRSDMLNDEFAPHCMRFADESGMCFANHWSGGNSTKMGIFSLFYGISPTYEQYFESNKLSPVFIDRLLEQQYGMAIFTSYPMYAPACLDVTVFVKVPNLRLETKIPGPRKSYRNDSAITVQWKEWLDNKTPGQPFFGFLFYDALYSKSFPPAYESGIQENVGTSELQKKNAHYKLGMHYIDSLVNDVLVDLENRGALDSTVVIITADHGEEFDDSRLGINGHGSAFSDYQVRVPLIVRWPGRAAGVSHKRTSHNDIVATLMKDALGCTNPETEYSSGYNLFSDKQWDWLIVGSYYNFAIIEPGQVTVQFPGGYYEVRDHNYLPLKKATVSPNIASAMMETGKFFKK